MDDLDPIWLARARREIGVREVAGGVDNPRIVYYHSFTRLKATDDETPWCSAFVCAMLELSGFATTRSAAARSWLDYGDLVLVPNRGDVLIFDRASRTNPKAAHVCFWTGAEDDRGLHGLGGNQGNRVCVAPYSRDRLLGIRRPL